MKPETFHESLKNKMDSYAHLFYRLTRKFPRDDLFGVVSQIRRSALSIILNYIEGHARNREKEKVYKNFLEISYGSLKESKCLLHFSLVEKYLSIRDYKQAIEKAEKVGAMLWGIIKNLQ
ncbi:MAG: four helix bundle protein [Candidatus Pacebacteria bacterium]|nr:four helix bundle protein [Candidatus Paceibacterota bacterium]